MDGEGPEKRERFLPAVRDGHGIPFCLEVLPHDVGVVVVVVDDENGRRCRHGH